MLNKITHTLGLLLLFCLAACTEPSSEFVKIAAIAPVTGPQGEVGEDLINGVRMAVEEVNTSGGILGKQVELVVMDDKADPKEAVSVANKIVSDPTIVGIIGHMNSGTMLAASPVYGSNGLPVVMPVPTNPDITTQGFTNLFRVPATDADQGPAGAVFALERLNKQRIAVIHDKTAYGQGIAEEFRGEIEAKGVELVAYEGITEGDKDFRAVLSRIKQSNPDLLFFGGIYNEGGLIAKQSQELGLDVTFLAADGSFGSTFVEIAGAAAEGAIFSFIAPDRDSNVKTAEFFDAFSDKFGRVVSFAPLGYDAAHVLLAGINRAGTVDAPAIVETLHADDFSTEGVTGTIQFESNGNNKNKNLTFYTVKEGQFVLFAD